MKGNGIGGELIYGIKFLDENFVRRYGVLGILLMVNVGFNSNGFQFFIIIVFVLWFDGKYVVFGVVVEGFNVVKVIEVVGFSDGKICKVVIIFNCG